MDPLHILDAPVSLAIQDVKLTPSLLRLTVESTGRLAACPVCGAMSRRVHSRYERHLDDLPWGALAVRLKLMVRRFFFTERACERRVFTERLPGWVTSWARRTLRLEGALRLFGFALGGEAGARLAASLGMATSPDTIIRLVVSTPLPPAPRVRVLGVDDWAWKKGLSYGTVLVDLARRRVLDLLPDRAADSLSRWLDAHPEIEIVARDRAGCYAEGTSRGAPQARQVADRWHLLANLTDAMRRLVERRWRAVRDAFQVIEASEPRSQLALITTPQAPAEAAEPPPLPESTSRARRHARFEQVRALHAEGVGLREIARQLGMSRNTVRRFLCAEHFPERAKRPPAPSSIAVHHVFLRQQWNEGCRGRTKLHQALIERGYTGSVTPLRRWIAWMRQSQPETAPRSPERPAAERLPSVRRVTWRSSPRTWCKSASVFPGLELIHPIRRRQSRHRLG